MPPLKHVALGSLALVFAVGVLVAAWLTFPQAQPDAAMFVPAEETVAFLGNVTPESFAAMPAQFPMFGGIPMDADSPVDVAYMTKDGHGSWATFKRSKTAKNGFEIRTSGPDADALLMNVTTPLATDRTYRQLTTGMNDSDPWAYLRFPDIQSVGDGAIDALAQNTPASIIMMKDGMRVRFVKDTLSNLPTLSQAPLTVFDDPVLIVQSSDLATMIDAANDLITDAVRIPVAAVLQNTLKNLFGSSVSARYDLLPLLGNTATIHLADGPDAHLRVLIDGALPRDPTVLLSLPDLFKGKLGTVTKHTQTFDEKFTMDSVRRNTDVISDAKVRSANGWQVRTMEQTETKQTLILALRGDRYLLGNDAQAVERAMNAVPTMLPVSTPQPVMLGLIKSANMTELIRRTLPTLWWSYIIPSGTGGYLQWNVSQDGPRLTILLKKT